MEISRKDLIQTDVYVLKSDDSTQRVGTAPRLDLEYESGLEYDISYSRAIFGPSWPIRLGCGEKFRERKNLRDV